MELEEYGYVIYKNELKSSVYVLGTKKFTPLELCPKKDQNIDLFEKVYFGTDKRDKIDNVVKWISEKEFLEANKTIVIEVIEKIVFEKIDYYLDFINNNILKEEYKNYLIRALCIGPKTFEKIYNARKDKYFTGIDDLERRAGTKIIIKNISSKIYGEICGKDRFRIFSNKAKHLD